MGLVWAEALRVQVVLQGYKGSRRARLAVSVQLRQVRQSIVDGSHVCQPLCNVEAAGVGETVVQLKQGEETGLDVGD